MPLIIDDISITVITPITTPTIVSTERILLARNVSIAILKFSKNEPVRNFILYYSCCLFISQSFDRVEPSRFPGRVQACHNANAARDNYGQNSRPPGNAGRKNQPRNNNTGQIG